MNAHLLPTEIAHMIFERAHSLWAHGVSRNLDVTIRPLLRAYPCCGAVTVAEHTFNQNTGRCTK